MGALQIGSLLGKYEIIAEIGQGGMSVVYRARDTRLKRDVAVKVMHAFLAEQPEARERFYREAVAVARLHHPHIIEIFDFSDPADDAAHADATESYIVSELVEGQALSAWLDQRRLVPPETALILARPIADALEHAHNAGVIHRDLKPENILVGTDGSLKLTDFGIARMLDNQTMTMTGTLLGSPAYMAPEYIDGQATDARADVFSFGAMLYQMLVGHLPFTAPSPHALLKRIAAGEYAAANQENPQVHAALARLVDRCLAHDPDDRWPTAHALLGAIDAQLIRLGIDAETARPRLLTDRDAYGADLEGDLPRRYFDLGRSALARHETGAALDDFDRVLSLEPDHAAVRRILDRLSRRAMGRRVVRDLAVATAGALLVTAVSVAWVNAHPAVGAPATDTTPPPLPLSVPIGYPPAGDHRDVAFVLTGHGALYVGSRLIRRDAAGALSVQLAPGVYQARLAGSKKTDSQIFVVPADPNATVSPVELRVAAGPPAEAPGPKGPQRPKLPVKLRQVQLNLVNPVTLYVDGNTKPLLKQRWGLVTVPLAYGTRHLRFVNKHSEPLEMTLRVSATQPPGRVVIKLQPLPARLLVTGVPNNYFIEVGNKRWPVGPGTRNEPIRVPLPQGRGTMNYEVRILDAHEHEVHRETVEFRTGQQRTLAVNLHPR